MSDVTERPVFSSRVQAVLWGALVPLGIGVTGIVALLDVAMRNGAAFRGVGVVGRILFILPGALMISALFAFPIAIALVVTMTWLMRRTRVADHVAAWALAGSLFAFPLAFVFGSFTAPHWLPGMLVGTALGVIGGLAAGLRRPTRLV